MNLPWPARNKGEALHQWRIRHPPRYATLAERLQDRCRSNSRPSKHPPHRELRLVRRAVSAGRSNVCWFHVWKQAEARLERRNKAKKEQEGSEDGTKERRRRRRRIMSYPASYVSGRVSVERGCGLGAARHCASWPTQGLLLPPIPPPAHQARRRSHRARASGRRP